MKIQLYITNPENQIAGALLEFKGEEHCTGDIRANGSDRVDVMFSKTTNTSNDNDLKRALNDCVKMEIMKIVEVEVDENDVMFEPFMISCVTIEADYEIQ